MSYLAVPYPRPKNLSPAFLKGKRILFIAANFFGLHRLIVDGLQRVGASVKYYDERPGNDFMTKALIRCNRDLIGSKVDRYYDQIIDATHHEDFDYVFIVKGECIAPSSIAKLRTYHPRALFILYQWDTVSYNPQFFKIRSLFDRLTSFDPSDCKEYGMDFLPLFYTPDYAEISKSVSANPIDLLFVGTVHYDRYPLVQEITRQINELGGKTYQYLYFQHKLMYYKKRYVDCQLKGAKRADFNFSPLPYSGIIDLYKRSRIVLDVQKPKQIGQTLRSFETLGGARKLITTNTDIVNYDFYDPSRILVVDRDNPVITPSFFNAPYKPVSPDIYESYSLSSWLANQFSLPTH